MATVITIPTSPDLASKKRLLEGFLRAYGHELAYLNRQRYEGKISEAEYNSCCIPIGNDIKVINDQKAEIDSQTSIPVEVPIEGLHTQDPKNQSTNPEGDQSCTQ